MEVLEPKIIKKETFKIIGMKYFGKNQNNEIINLWNSFYNRINEIKNAEKNTSYYGICELFYGTTRFSYIASIKVKNSIDIPKEMFCKIIPSSTYAVFTHKGSLNSLGQTYEYIYGTWLPNSSYEHSILPDIEEFNDIYYKDHTKEFSINIYIPIKVHSNK